MFALIEQGKGNCEKDRDNCYPKDDAVYRGNQCLIGLGAAHWSVRLGLIQKLSQGAEGEIPGGESDIRQNQEEHPKNLDLPICDPELVPVQMAMVWARSELVVFTFGQGFSGTLDSE